MASLGHVAVGLALARHAQEERPRAHPWVMSLLFAALALLPDLDVVAFKLGIPYAAPFGHRGASHSLFVAIALGALIGLALRTPGRPAWRILALTVVALASHGPLDALTDGGLGPALAWPFSDARVFAPLRPIPVSPIGQRLLSARGLHVLLFELAWFSPFLVYGLWPRRRGSSRSARESR